MGIAEMTPIQIKPRVLYLPVSPGFPDGDMKPFYFDAISNGKLDVVVFETYMSGGVCSEEPYSLVPLIVHAARHVPTFLVPEGRTPQTQRLRDDLFYALKVTENGAFPLDAACSGMAHEIGADITRLWAPDPTHLISGMKFKYQQGRTPR